MTVPVEAVTYGKEIFLSGLTIVAFLVFVPSWCKGVDVPDWFKLAVLLGLLAGWILAVVGGLIWIWG